MTTEAVAGNDTAGRILEATEELLNREGADAVSMRRVAAAVGITAMAVYRHFPNRQGLLNAVADAGFREFAERLNRAPSGERWEARMNRILETWLDFALENPRLFELMFLRRRTGARRFPEDFRAGLSPTANVLAAVIEEGMRQGDLRQDDGWEITFEMGALLQGLLMLYLGGRISGTAADFRAQCHRSLRRYCDGIRA
jgi:AcrR family transcriptional regulator